MSKLSTGILYGSLVFTLVYLYRFDYLSVPHVARPGLLGAATLLVVAALTFESLAWRHLLRIEGIEVSRIESVAATGTSVLGKYIPGKVWLIVGRAAYVAAKRDVTLATVSIITLNAQILSLWVALLIGLIGLALVGGLAIYGPIALATWLGFSAILFGRRLHGWIERTIDGRWPGRDVQLPFIAPRAALRVSPHLFACWCALALGFGAMMASLAPTSLEPSAPAALGFPLAAALGMVAFFAPGGLGVREGILAGYLILCGISAEWSATIAIASRLWFLAGELSFFALGIAARRAAPEAAIG